MKKLVLVLGALVALLIPTGCGAGWDYVTEAGVKVQDYLGSGIGKQYLDIAVTAIEVAKGLDADGKSGIPWDEFDVVVIDQVLDCVNDRKNCADALADEGYQLGPRTIVLGELEDECGPGPVKQLVSQVANFLKITDPLETTALEASVALACERLL